MGEINKEDIVGWQSGRLRKGTCSDTSRSCEAKEETLSDQGRMEDI